MYNCTAYNAYVLALGIFTCRKKIYLHEIAILKNLLKIFMSFSASYFLTHIHHSATVSLLDNRSLQTDTTSDTPVRSSFLQEQILGVLVSILVECLYYHTGLLVSR